MQINRIILIFFCFILIILLFPTNVRGHIDDKINFIEIKIDIKRNGNAVITETWDVNSKERFSYFKLYKNIKKGEIINFTVVDEKDISYEILENWDIYMPNEQKIKKCGINYTDEGAELCWGVEKDGFHSYTLNYEVVNFELIKYNFIDGRFKSSSWKYGAYYNFG